MGRRFLAGVWCVSAAVLAGGCTDNTRENTPPPVALRFERVEVQGVTTDHASTGGVCWVDIDGDKDLDLFVANGYDVSADSAIGQPNRLYRNNGRGEFVEVTTGLVVTTMGISSGAAWADADNDGDLDAFVSNQQDQNNFLFRNEGDDVFVSAEDAPQVADGGHSYTAAWIDADRDGWLDLFVANGGMSHMDTNAVYRGMGGGRFEKLTGGPLVSSETATCAVAWGDYDNDGDSDLFITNTGFASPANNNALYRNDGNWTFTPITNSPAVTDESPSSAATWVDIDNDLDLDLHVTTMYGLAGFLYRNDGTGTLTLDERSALSLESAFAYGANWEDYDNDGDIDVIVANWGAAPALYTNDGAGNFTRASAGDLGATIHYAGAIASADFDADGDIDVYIGNWPNEPGDGEPNALYRNDTGGHWLRVRLVGRRSNRSGIGARVVVTCRTGSGRRSQMRETSTQSGFRGQSDVSPHFGMGQAVMADSLVVRWPSGAVSTLTDVAADRVVEVTEP